MMVVWWSVHEGPSLGECKAEHGPLPSGLGNLPPDTGSDKSHTHIPGKIDVGLPAQGVWYPHFWGLPLVTIPLVTRHPPQWLHKNCQHPLCPPPLCLLSPLLSSPQPLTLSLLILAHTVAACLSPLLPSVQNTHFTF